MAISSSSPESCFQIRNFPINIETTNIKYRIVAEVFKGGRKFSRVRLVVKSKDAATHTKEQIVLVRKNSLDGCFRELVYLKEGTTDITTPIKFLGRFSYLLIYDFLCKKWHTRTAPLHCKKIQLLTLLLLISM